MTSATEKLATLAIGAAGELQVQYRLLKLGVDSARLTTDSGIDLVMYVPGRRQAATVQVKSKYRSVSQPVARASSYSVGPFPDDSPAQWLACVDLSTDSVWLFTLSQARKLAQQKHAGGTRMLYWYTDESVGPKARRQSEMESYRLDTVTTKLIKATR